MSARSAVSGISQTPRELAEQSRRCVPAAPATWFQETQSRSPADGPPCRAAPRPSRSHREIPPLCGEAGVAVLLLLLLLPLVDSTMRQCPQLRRCKPCALNHWNGSKTHLFIIRKHFPPPSATDTRPGLAAAFSSHTKAASAKQGDAEGKLSSAVSGRVIHCVRVGQLWQRSPRKCFLREPQVTHLPRKAVC